MTDRPKQRYRTGKRRIELTEEAVEIAMIWDSLPDVAQQYVLTAIDAMRRLEQENGAIARRVWSRASPKQIKKVEQSIEDFQTSDRAKRRG